MANWASTSYCIEGSKENLKKIFKAIDGFMTGRIQRANALHRKVIKSFRKNTQKEYKNLIFLLVED